MENLLSTTKICSLSIFPSKLVKAVAKNVNFHILKSVYLTKKVKNFNFGKLLMELSEIVSYLRSELIIISKYNNYSARKIILN